MSMVLATRTQKYSVQKLFTLQVELRQRALFQFGSENSDCTDCAGSGGPGTVRTSRAGLGLSFDPDSNSCGKP
jgi:hypothetical protein